MLMKARGGGWDRGALKVEGVPGPREIISSNGETIDSPAPGTGTEATRVTPLNSETQRSTPEQCLGSKSSLQGEEGPLEAHALLV